MRFQNAYVQNPICTPSRVCWHSGQYAHNHGYYGLSGPKPSGLPTVLGHFRRHGYKTAAIGKIHCPEYWVEDDSDVFHETCTCSAEGQSKAYQAYLKECDQFEHEDHMRMPDFPGTGQSMDSRPSRLSFDESQEGWSVNTAIEFMTDASKMLTLSFFMCPYHVRINALLHRKSFGICIRPSNWSYRQILTMTVQVNRRSFRRRKPNGAAGIGQLCRRMILNRVKDGNCTVIWRQCRRLIMQSGDFLIILRRAV